MMLMKKLMLILFFSGMLSVPFVESAITNSVAEQSIEIGCGDFKSDKERFVDDYEYNYRQMEIRKEIERQEQERLRLEEERKRQEELERQRIEEEKSRLVNKLGYEPSKVVKVNCKVTFYYADSTSLQGGYNDKKGIPLKSHNEPIVALPSDVTYGSYIEFDKSIRGNTLFKNVDTGGAIKWLDSNTIVVDVFVPEASSYNELISMVENTTTTATIYYK